MPPLRIALPKGRLFQSTIDLLQKSGIAINLEERNYRPLSNHRLFQFYIVKPRNIPSLIKNGYVDVGFVGIDLLEDEGVNLPSLDLGILPVYLVVAGKKGYPLKKKKRIVIATEYVRLAREYCKKKKLSYSIIKTYGCTECFVPDFADVIVDHAQTGKTLEKNNLIILDVIMKSTLHLVFRDSLTPTKKKALHLLKNLLNQSLFQVDRTYPSFLEENKVFGGRVEC